MHLRITSILLLFAGFVGTVFAGYIYGNPDHLPAQPEEVQSDSIVVDAPSSDLNSGSPEYDYSNFGSEDSNLLESGSNSGYTVETHRSVELFESHSQPELIQQQQELEDPYWASQESQQSYQQASQPQLSLQQQFIPQQRVQQQQFIQPLQQQVIQPQLSLLQPQLGGIQPQLQRNSYNYDPPQAW